MTESEASPPPSEASAPPSSPPGAMAKLVNPKRNSMSRLPVLRKVSATVGTSAPSSPTTTQMVVPDRAGSLRNQIPLASGERRIPRPGIPTIAKRSSSSQLGGSVVGGDGTRSISKSGGPSFSTATSSSQAKVTPRKTSSLNLKARASLSNLQTKPSEPQLARKVSASALQSPRVSTTPKGRRTSDINGLENVPALNRRASNTQLRQPSTVARKASNGNLPSNDNSNGQLARKSSLARLGPSGDASPTPLRRQSSVDFPRAPQTPTQARSPMKPPQTRPLEPRLAARPPKPQQIPKSPESPQKAPGAHKIASQSLRDTIAKARAAKSTTTQNTATTNGNGLDGFNFGTGDPFSQAILGEGGSEKVIQQRAKTARFEGRLNLANLQLKEIPAAVYKMYDSNEDDLTAPGDDNGPKWYESVDLVKMVAADNEIEVLGEELVQQFGGLETLDMHNNLLKSLPSNLTQLSQLSILNLINNKIDNSLLEIIFQMTSLKDLKLARNSLEGDLDASISNLINLETLELQQNKITSLPDSIGELTRLRILNVSTNALESLPMERLSNCHLQQLDVSTNRLQGTFFPASIERWESLQSLNLKSNRITAFSESAVVLPALNQLFITNNQIQEFPDITGWNELLILLVNQNQISEIPEELFNLPRLRTLDFSSNNFKALDARLGVMESLEVITFAGNPLRERHLASLATADLKKTLRGRLAPEIVIAEAEDDIPGVVPGTGIGAELTKTTIEVGRGGMLDLSNKGYSEFTEEITSSIIGSPVALLLANNSLSVIPRALETFASLSSLDLSGNRLDECYLPTKISLRSLEILNLRSTSLTSLDLLYTHLDAPRLATLDVSANRITSIAGLRQHFQVLTVLHAADNQVSEIPVADIDGVRTLDLTGNAITALPSQLGLCQGLRDLRVQGNLFRVPRWQVLEKGSDTVLQWLRDRLPDAEEAIEEAKADM
ncbi:hypothetical protein EDC01DRAFT_223145 [Geopyxis carbonaria]|nr:hypothetical protein EDC01DRAFT_223145 [Geopyxis carbonaria]